MLGPPSWADEAHSQGPMRFGVAIVVVALVVLQLILIIEARSGSGDATVPQGCGTAFWPMVLARFIVSMSQMVAMLACKSAYDEMRWAQLVTHLAFAIAMTVVLALLPQGVSGCNHALEQAAGITHSYALLVVAFFYVVLDWVGFLGGAFLAVSLL